MYALIVSKALIKIKQVPPPATRVLGLLGVPRVLVLRLIVLAQRGYEHIRLEMFKIPNK
jgi:hypothetical protein